MFVSNKLKATNAMFRCLGLLSDSKTKITIYADSSRNPNEKVIKDLLTYFIKREHLKKSEYDIPKSARENRSRVLFL